MIFNLLAISAIASQAFAGGAELIVRFREPQNTLIQVTESVQKHGLILHASDKVVNAEQGLVKLSFSTVEEAIAARDRLLVSGEVLSVAPNLLYRPALHLAPHPATDSEGDSRALDEDRTSSTFLAIPFVGTGRNPRHPRRPGHLEPLPMAGIPEVELPGLPGASGADPLIAQDWVIPAIHMDRIGSVMADPSMIAAVIDTGVDYNHEDLIGAMWRKPGNPKEVGFDFAHNTATPYDRVHFDIQGCMNDFRCQLGLDQEKYLVNPGHGTHCAGHVAAVANNALGIRGMGAGARVMGIKFFYDVGEVNAGQGDDAAAISAIDYAIKNGAKVISASWGGRVKRAEAETSELKLALTRARDAGVLFVVAAGNDSVDQDTIADPSYPAAYALDNMIVVAASDRTDHLADFSSFGAQSVHIAAPGVKILSTVAPGTSGGKKYDDVVANFTDPSGHAQAMDWDGTSMATPVVAGATALVWSKFPNENYHQIRDRLLNSARKVPALTGKVSTGGVLDVAAALRP